MGSTNTGWRRRGTPNACVPGLHLIALDTSGATRQSGRLARAKDYSARLIEQATRADEQVALPFFGCQGEELLLPPGPARAEGSARVYPVSGGGTPLAVCLQVAERILRVTTARAFPTKSLACGASLMISPSNSSA